MKFKNDIEGLIAAYLQTKIRYEKLKNYISEIDVSKISNKEEPKHDCSVDLLKCHLYAMEGYLSNLELCFYNSNIDLENYVIKQEEK